MEKICLMADSACDLTREMARDNDIRVLPVTITYDGVDHKEFYEIEISEYWDYLESHEELPHTAQITPTQFIEAFKSAKSDGYTKIICLLMNAAGSGTYASGMVARDMYLEEFGGDMDIRVIDSKGYTIAYGYALVRAREAINSGAQFDDVVEIVYDHISRVEAVAAVYTLGQMRKSGRIGGAAGLMGELLGIKPVIRLCDGVVDVIEKVRGERALLAKLTECVGERIDREANQNDACFIIYGKVEPADIDFVEDYIKHDIGISNVRRVPFGCSITTNTGPNVIGIVYYGKKRG